MEAAWNLKIWSWKMIFLLDLATCGFHAEFRGVKVWIEPPDILKMEIQFNIFNMI